jgi:predicted PurR-regulated permease PerM
MTTKSYISIIISLAFLFFIALPVSKLVADKIHPHYQDISYSTNNEKHVYYNVKIQEKSQNIRVITFSNGSEKIIAINSLDNGLEITNPNVKAMNINLFIFIITFVIHVIILFIVLYFVLRERIY